MAPTPLDLYGHNPFSTRYPDISVARHFDFFTTREGQASYLNAAYDIARRSPFIAAFGWIGLLDDPVNDPSGATFGLMTYEGERKPAYYAYQQSR